MTAEIVSSEIVSQTPGVGQECQKTVGVLQIPEIAKHGLTVKYRDDHTRI